MDKHYLPKIKLINKEGVELTARYLQTGKNRSVIFYCPGFGGGLGKLGEELADFAQENGYGFFFGQFQDSYSQKITVRHLCNGQKEDIIIGGSNARLYNCLADFETFFDFIDQQGYDKIFCVAMCVSCSKLVYFLQNNDYYNKMVSNLILLAPQDFTDFKNSPAHVGLEEEAINNVRNKMSDKILSKKFLGYMDISSITFLDYTSNRIFNTLSYKSDKKKLEYLNRINAKILFVMGSLDYAIRNNSKAEIEEYFKILTLNCRNSDYIIVDGARHLFNGKEGDLVQIIEQFILGENKEVDKCL